MTAGQLHPVQRPGRVVQGVERPRSLTHALEILAADPTVRPIAGGTDLLLDLHRGGPGEPVTLLDLSGLTELRGITINDGRVRIGAGVTHNEIVAHHELPTVGLPLAQACLEIGSPQLRNRATVAGNIATASPANDTISALLALDAAVTLASLAGERTLPLDDFFTGFRATGLEPGELITAVEFPAMSSPEDGIWVKLGNRSAQAISVVHLGIVVHRDEGGLVRGARIAIGSVAERVILLPEAAAALIGSPLTGGVIKRAAEAAVGAVVPLDDVRATAVYRVDIIPTLVTRALEAIAAGHTATAWPTRPVCLAATSDDRPSSEDMASINDTTEVAVTLNGQRFAATGAASANLLDWLRDEAGLTGAKEGCAEGECGACTVQLDGRSVMSCLVNAAQAKGAEIVTVEGVAPGPDVPHAIQQAFIDEFAVQCGFCIPGFIVSGASLLDEMSDPTDDEIRLGLSGNLCRCTGYYPIIQAIRTAAVNAT
ncbi:MAG: 2Fe-2S iron-sulfur cluster binding domain-containing protein [Actinobacteria bacterium]|nr:2Fe-2S iron-sulfur cluster binding domain-containing protein [Actinomycetota bacterium]NCG36478.1 2Fe-2S iron-sulfur cluster binding domain-containing protein [Actinomycetota bacterium]